MHKQSSKTKPAIFIAAAAVLVIILLKMTGYHQNSPPDNSGNWVNGSRDANGTYFSPLTTIDAQNVEKLGFAWSYDMNTFRGQEATPLVVDGIMYTSGIW